jgi:putative transposase
MEPLQTDTSYHIFNHANGFENVFRDPENYRYFLEKYRLYISPIAETYAYCLMPNHFHLVIRIRKREALETLIRNKTDSTKNNFSKVSILEKSVNVTQNEFDKTKSVNFGKVLITISDSEIEKFLSKQFANLFSSYTQSFNKVYKRMGSLFIKNFKRVPILDKQNFINTIIYTHRNPIHHGFRQQYDEWDFSSYNEIVENKSDTVVVEKLLKMTGGKENFIALHRRNLERFNFNNQPEIP